MTMNLGPVSQDDPAALHGSNQVVDPKAYNAIYVLGVAFVASAGAYEPTTREVDTETITRATRRIIDSRKDCLDHAGDFMIPVKEGAITRESIAEIAEVVAWLASDASSYLTGEIVVAEDDAAAREHLPFPELGAPFLVIAFELRKRQDEAA